MSRGSADPDTVIACRVHDECNGSDVFGSDICTCRPYLVHGVEVCVETAQQGGVGHRRLQPQGRPRARRGDQVPRLQRPQAAGGRRQRRHLFPPHRMRRRRAGHALPGADARCLPLARHPPHRPLGVDVEHEARRAARRRASRSVEQVPIPDGLVPLDAQVEIAAKKAAGYFAPAGAPSAARSCAAPRAASLERVSAALARDLLSAAAVRERCAIVLAAAERGETRHFRLVPERLDDAVEPRRRGDPPALSRSRRAVSQPLAPFRRRRGRSRGAGRARRRPAETARARLDLAIVSVLLDAGAGPRWRYREAATGLMPGALRGAGGRQPAGDAGGPVLRRSGRAVARRCRGAGGDLGRERSAARFSTRRDNPLAGLEGRAALLRRLGEVVAGAPEIFGGPARLGQPVRLSGCRTASRPAGAGDAAADPARARADLAGAARRSTACRSAIAAATGGARRRAGAVSQAQPMAGLFAGRAARSSGIPRSPTSTG